MDPKQAKIKEEFAQQELFELGHMDYHAFLRHLCNRKDLNPKYATIETLAQDIYLLYPRLREDVVSSPTILCFDGSKYGLLEPEIAEEFSPWHLLPIDEGRLSTIRECGPSALLRILPGVVLGPHYVFPERSLADMLAEAEVATS
jgi:hypothetical protein